MSERPESSAGVLSLKIPGQPQYIGIARLAVSGLVNRLESSFDDAEDFKLAVTEACSHILRKSSRKVDLLIDCHFTRQLLEIRVKSVASHTSAVVVPLAEGFQAGGDGELDLGVHLIGALMDSVKMETDSESGLHSVQMTRHLAPGAVRDG